MKEPKAIVRGEPYALPPEYPGVVLRSVDPAAQNGIIAEICRVVPARWLVNHVL